MIVTGPPIQVYESGHKDHLLMPGTFPRSSIVFLG